MILQSATLMESAFFLKIRLMRFFGGRIVADPAILASLNLRNENLSSLTPMDAKKPTLVVGLRLVKILVVYLARRVSQVRPSVVMADAVDVVNAQIWMLAIHPQKNQPMFKVGMGMKSQNPVPESSNAAGAFSLSGPVSPCKESGLGVVMKKFAQTLCGKISVSHDALQRQIGQRPPVDLQSLGALSW